MLRWFRATTFWMLMSITTLTSVGSGIGQISSWGQIAVYSAPVHISGSVEWRLVFQDVNRGLSKTMQAQTATGSFSPSDWSADGMKIVGKGGDDMYVMSLPDFQMQNVSQSPDYNEMFPMWSDDGRRLAFSASQEAEDGHSRNFIGVLDTESGQRIYQPLADEQSFASWRPVWSSDSQIFAYITQRYQPTRSSVEIVKVDQDQLVTQFSYSEHNPSNPRWSPDGKWLAFETTEYKQVTTGGMTYPKDFRQIWIADAHTGEARQLVDGQTQYGFAWSPDSQHIAYTVWQYDDHKNLYEVLMIADIETNTFHPLTAPPYDASVPGWSPDGRWLALIGRQNNIETVDLIDAVTGERQQLGTVEGVPSMSSGLPPTWSSDGRWLAVFTDYYINNTSSIPRTYIVNVEKQEVSPYFEYLSGFMWRP